MRARGAAVPHATSPRKWTFAFQSVIGYGPAHELTADAERIAGLNQIMRHSSGREWPMGGESLDALRMWKVTIESLTGKQSKEKLID